MGAGLGVDQGGGGGWKGERERDGGALPGDETKRLLVTSSTWGALHSQSTCPAHPSSQGVVGGPDPGFRAQGLMRRLCRGGEDIGVGWQPPRVGTLAGSMLPFISPGLTSDPAAAAAAAVVTAYFGVLHSGRMRSFLQQSEPPSPRQCLPRPLRHCCRHHLHSVPGSHLLSPYSLGICPQAPAPPQPFGCGAAASCLGPCALPSEPEALTPLPGSTLFRGPLCTSHSALRVGTLSPALSRDAPASSPSSIFHWGL